MQRASGRSLVSWLLLFAAAGVVACSAATGLADEAALEAGGPATSGEHGAGTAVVRGVVIGISFPDSAETQLAGATITAYRREGPTNPADSASTPPTLVKQGTVTSDAAGNFELAAVPAGYYLLDVVAPAGSGYQDGRSGTVSLPAASTDRARVYLYRFP